MLADLFATGAAERLFKKGFGKHALLLLLALDGSQSRARLVRRLASSGVSSRQAPRLVGPLVSSGVSSCQTPRLVRCRGSSDSGSFTVRVYLFQTFCPQLTPPVLAKMCRHRIGTWSRRRCYILSGPQFFRTVGRRGRRPSLPTDRPPARPRARPPARITRPPPPAARRPHRHLPLPPAARTTRRIAPNIFSNVRKILQ